jgi:pimeloyl-ACP methyl ester carboxylesterase
MGVICQLLAAGGHRKSPEQLRAIADVIGRGNIMIMHGTGDNMIGIENGRALMTIMEPGTALVVEGMSHTPVLDRPHWFNQLLEEKVRGWDKDEQLNR